MLAFAVGRVMEREATAQTGAATVSKVSGATECFVHHLVGSWRLGVACESGLVVIGQRQNGTMTFASLKSAEWRTDPALSRNLKPPAFSRWSIHTIYEQDTKCLHGQRIR